jgi:hypothetical protein
MTTTAARLVAEKTFRRPSMSQRRTGGCLCGAIRYETVGDPVFTLRCHCRDCQRQSGAAHVPAARVPSAGFRILEGAPRRYVTKADSGNEIVRVFCGDCGTPLYVQVATRPDLGGFGSALWTIRAGSGRRPISSCGVHNPGIMQKPVCRSMRATHRDNPIPLPRRDHDAQARSPAKRAPRGAIR